MPGERGRSLRSLTHSDSITLSLSHCSSFLNRASAASLSRAGLTPRVRGLRGARVASSAASAAAAQRRPRTNAVVGGAAGPGGGGGRGAWHLARSKAAAAFVGRNTPTTFEEAASSFVVEFLFTCEVEGQVTGDS